MEHTQVRWMRTPLDAETRPRALAALSEQERERLAASSDATGESFLAGRWLLRTLVADLAGVAPEDVRIAATCPDCDRAHGAPTVAGLGVHVSLSRAEGVVVAAANRRSPIGIDAEAREQSGERLDAINALTGTRSVQQWTRTEAVLKADGRGLRLDPRAVSITGDHATIAGGTATYELHDVTVEPDLCVTLAVKTAATAR